LSAVNAARTAWSAGALAAGLGLGRSVAGALAAGGRLGAGGQAERTEHGGDGKSEHGAIRAEEDPGF
jgi:hypothetical protein